MATRDQVFPSKFLKAEDLKGRPRLVTIAKAPLETLKGTDGKEVPKTVLYFKDRLKSLPLNRVNWDSVADILGKYDSDDWAGGSIVLYPTETEMAGKRVACIRVRTPNGDAKKAKKADKAEKAAPADDADMDDEIPF